MGNEDFMASPSAALLRRLSDFVYLRRTSHSHAKGHMPDYVDQLHQTGWLSLSRRMATWGNEYFLVTQAAAELRRPELFRAPLTQAHAFTACAPHLFLVLSLVE